MTARRLLAVVKGLPRTATLAVVAVVLIATFAPILAPHDPNYIDLPKTLAGPGWQHLLGTDDLGRDELSRLLAAAQTTATTVLLVLVVAIVAGGTIGLLAATIGGVIDNFLMRLVDVAMSLPSLIVALAVLGAIGPGYSHMALALSLAWWPNYARVVRNSVLSTRQQPYVEAVNVLGAHPLRVVLRYLLPPAVGATLVYASGDAGGLAVSVATLSFLGLGVKPPQAEWGQMLVTALPYMQSNPMLVLLPGLALTGFVAAWNAFSRSIAVDTLPRRVSARGMRRRRASLPAPAARSPEAAERAS
ncbi:MAG: ABC transporter permease [Candidatus Dormibacter sp.]|uniref:ABC transporter permease n=1 Tax=Candidatus Dormibacter sp. TaxID=2973982 RepID=UPI000DB75157|nr:MAG: ABC transporter permease [Candidatus Dormibacteraeota bacterium]